MDHIPPSTNDAAIAERLAGTWVGDGPSNSGAALVFSENDQFQSTAPGKDPASGTYKFVKTGSKTGTLTFTGSGNGVYTYTDTTQTQPYKWKETGTFAVYVSIGNTQGVVNKLKSGVPFTSGASTTVQYSDFQ